MAELRLNCEHCGAGIKAPRSVAGQRHTCPQCGGSVYIPMPEEDIEEIALAKEDQADLQRERDLDEERRRLDAVLARETDGAEDAASRPAASSGSGLKATVIAYLRAMRDSNLDVADEAMALLLKQRKAARSYVEQLTADQIPPPELAQIPPAVYQGFLKNLLSQL